MFCVKQVKVKYNKVFLVGSMLKNQPRKSSKPRTDREVKYQFVENLKSHAKEERNIFESRAKEKRSQKNSIPHADRGAEHQFVKNSKPRAKVERNHFKSRVKEKRNQKNSKPLADRRAEH